MRTSRLFSSCLLTLAALLALSATSLAADPGVPFPADGAVNDQKPGSLLIYNVYSSSATNPGLENTRINITNIANVDVSVHIYFIDGTSCSPADVFVCLTQNQTASFRASDFDPGTMGYIVAMATDQFGCPIVQNSLIGDLYVKFASGHAANLGAEAVAADLRGLPACSPDATMATLAFNGTQYDRLPATVAVDNLPSSMDGNDTLLILNRVSGDLAVGADRLGAIFGFLYNDAENPYSFGITSNQCQLKISITNTTPRTTPRFTTVVPAGRSGWMKLYAVTGNTPLLGAVINYNPAASASPTAFSGGHNLHKLTLVPAATISVPIFPANCFD